MGKHHEVIDKILASRQDLADPSLATYISRKEAGLEAEGGCGVIGLAASEQISGKHLLQALKQMRNRGNGKGGGIAAVGLDPQQFGVDREILLNDYLLVVAYLDPKAREEVEKFHIYPCFEVDHSMEMATIDDYRSLEGLDCQPPQVYCYFVRVKDEEVEKFTKKNSVREISSRQAIEEEIVYQNTFKLNYTFYAKKGQERAFVLSHAKNLLVLKMVGYGDDVLRYYCLENIKAHVWIGHHRYPTKGKVWHPGGAHPFIGLNEALVHNGDFANYASIASYLRQANIRTLFDTDTEVASLLFDLHHRVYRYPLEYVIESLAPTTERDFYLLSKDKQEIYRKIQLSHIHGSPDGPWFFLIAQSNISKEQNPTYRLLGITDTSMLRPQVFALQKGEASIGLAASEKQGIDAALTSLAEEDQRFWSRADRYWSARGGSYTDGGAFLFSVTESEPGKTELCCTNKFGQEIQISDETTAYLKDVAPEQVELMLGDDLEQNFTTITEKIAHAERAQIKGILQVLEKWAQDSQRRGHFLPLLNRLLNRIYPFKNFRRSSFLAHLDKVFDIFIDSVKSTPCDHYFYLDPKGTPEEATSPERTIVIDAPTYQIEGTTSLAAAVIAAYKKGWRRFLIVRPTGHRFIGNGFGPKVEKAVMDVYGGAGDYLASGIDGSEIHLHGDGQDQLAQIIKSGKLVVYGDVGQAFMYGAKGGEVYVRGNAGGRALINAVGKPRVVINGTCLDYLAESFMAGNPLEGGGFVILNGVYYDERGQLRDLPSAYPGGNLFSLASGGGVYVRDPEHKLGGEQLNGGEFQKFTNKDWELILPYLQENERLFGISVDFLLTVGGEKLPPEKVYRKVRPTDVKALHAEEAWVHKAADRKVKKSKEDLEVVVERSVAPE